MIINRKDIQRRENEMLAPYAVRSSESKGRAYKEKEDEYRTCFQRDRDRIIHSKAFRRLNGKTQVFIAGYGDHYRSRLTHSMEVAQFARDIARMLDLNQDLAEAIGLAHDLGHTPFGHAGQDAMNEILEPYGSRFEHNEQSFRVLFTLEEKSDLYEGLNVSYEVLDGLLKHRTEYDHPKVFDHKMPSLEAQIVNTADEIAYQNHDIDDGLRSGILTFNNMEEVEIWNRVMKNVKKSDVSEIYRHQMVTGIMSLMVSDLTINTEKRIADFSIKSLNDVYDQDEPVAVFSEAMAKMAKELKDFLYKNFYQSKPVMQYNTKGQKIIKMLFKAYYDHPEKLPDRFKKELDSEEKHVVVKDYVAGMTDSYATELYNQF